MFLIFLISFLLLSLHLTFIAGQNQTTNVLYVNQKLQEGQYLLSNNSLYTALLQTDGNFVIYYLYSNYGTTYSLWSTNTYNQNNGVHVLQFTMSALLQLVDASNTIIYTFNTVIGVGSVYLTMQDDGNLVVYQSDVQSGSQPTVLWASGTNDLQLYYEDTTNTALEFNIPEYVLTLNVTLVGANGGSSNQVCKQGFGASGGPSAVVTTILTVPLCASGNAPASVFCPWSTSIYIYLGCGGYNDFSRLDSGNFKGGCYGGGNGYNNNQNSGGAGGGGASSIQLTSTYQVAVSAFDDIIMVAGGGGGATQWQGNCYGGGGGGTPYGQIGQFDDCSTCHPPAQGGTLFNGGDGENGNTNSPQAGSIGQAGSVAHSAKSDQGAGGGGGLYGGGASEYYGAAGGSSYCSLTYCSSSTTYTNTQALYIPSSTPTSSNTIAPSGTVSITWFKQYLAQTTGSGEIIAGTTAGGRKLKSSQGSSMDISPSINIFMQKVFQQQGVSLSKVRITCSGQAIKLKFSFSCRINYEHVSNYVTIFSALRNLNMNTLKTLFSKIVGTNYVLIQHNFKSIIPAPLSTEKSKKHMKKIVHKTKTIKKEKTIA